MTHEFVTNLVWLVPLPPLIAFALIVLFTNKNKALSHTVAISAAFLSWLGAMIIFWNAVTTEHLGKDPFTS
jgi:NADH-quinone oxidoreductase subunit L